jgi:tetratricopeptide (TPR) repeat protein
MSPTPENPSPPTRSPAVHFNIQHSIFNIQYSVLLLIAATLLAATFLAYIPALRAGYVWDDVAVAENRLLESAEGLWRVWTRPAENYYERHYWPLTYTTFWIERRVWGEAPFGYHFDNVLLHALNAILLWALLRRLAVPGALAAAALFALHPVHVEAVAWIIERKDLLAALFFLLGFLAFVRWEARRARLLYVLSLLLFVCAMWSKASAVSFPVALGLWMWWKRPRPVARDYLALAPFFLLAAVLGALDLWLYRSYEAPAPGLSIVEKCLLAGRALWLYAGKIVMPSDLALVYPKWEIHVARPGQWLPLLLAIGTLWALWVARHRLGRGPLALVLFFVASLAPALGFVEFAYMTLSFTADRFQYLPSAGLIVLFAAAWGRAADRWSGPGPARTLLVGALAALLTVFGVLTWRQARLYRDNETLFRHALALNPDASVARSNLGAILYDQGRDEEALSEFREVLRRDPAFADAHFNMGKTLYRQGDLPQAAHHYREAVRLRPGYFAAHYDLGILDFRAGRREQAAERFRLVLRLAPGHRDALRSLRKCGDAGNVESGHLRVE